MDKNPVNVLHIASGDLWAGAEVQLFTLAKALENNTNTKVHIILLNHGRLEKELISCGIDVTVLDESTLNGFQILHKLIHVIKKTDERGEGDDKEVRASHILLSAADPENLRESFPNSKRRMCPD